MPDKRVGALQARLRLPLPSATLGFGNLFLCHLTGDDVSTLDAVGDTAGASQIKPHVRLNVVLRDTVTFAIKDAKAPLCKRVSLAPLPSRTTSRPPCSPA